MPKDKRLKRKNVERLEYLQSKYPGDLTESEKEEITLLQALRNEFGER